VIGFARRAACTTGPRPEQRGLSVKLEARHKTRYSTRADRDLRAANALHHAPGPERVTERSLISFDAVKHGTRENRAGRVGAAEIRVRQIRTGEIRVA
jgi:hypothetical protein